MLFESLKNVNKSTLSGCDFNDFFINTFMLKRSLCGSQLASDITVKLRPWRVNSVEILSKSIAVEIDLTFAYGKNLK